MKRAYQSLPLLLLLCGCQETISATVTRFNALPQPLPAQSFTIVPQGLQVGDLEFQHAAALVAAALERYGFRPAPRGDKSPTDLVVLLQYGPAGSRTQIIDYGYGPGWRSWWGFPPYDFYTLYAQFLNVDILDGPAWRRGEQRMVFQGRAITETGVREINVVLPYLVDALFQRFPGLNGETIRVTVPVTDAGIGP